MKRSEAIEIIDKTLFDAEIGLLKRDGKVVCEEILKRLEEAGMLPPKRFNPEYDFNKEHLAAKAGADYLVPRYLHQWEPE